MEIPELRDKDMEELEEVEEVRLETEEFAGETVHTPEVDTAVEHLERHGEDYELIGNDSEGRKVKADLGSGYFLEVLNRGEKETIIRLGSETEDGTPYHYRSRFRKLVERERDSRKAAEMAVNRLEKEGDDIWQVFQDQLDGRSFDQVAADNFGEGLTDEIISIPYNFYFELKPWQSIESNRVEEYDGEMPSAEYAEEVEKYHYWFTKYLDNLTKELAYRTGRVEEDVAEKWLEGSPRAGKIA